MSRPVGLTGTRTRGTARIAERVMDISPGGVSITTWS
jgi:hypothetical protein